MFCTSFTILNQTMIAFIFCSGFGFITFKESDTVQKILKEHSENPLIVDDKPVRCHNNHIHIHLNLIIDISLSICKYVLLPYHNVSLSISNVDYVHKTSFSVYL